MGYVLNYDTVLICFWLNIDLTMDCNVLVKTENGLVYYAPSVNISWERAGHAACKFYWFMLQFGETWSSCLMATLSAERVFALYCPLRHQKLQKERTTKMLLFSVSGVAIALTPTSLFFADNIPIYGYKTDHQL